MPPTPLDSSNVYQKTLHVVRMADEHLVRVELQNRLHNQLNRERMTREVREHIELQQEREPATGIREDEERQERKQQRRRSRSGDGSGDEIDLLDDPEEFEGDLRKRRPEDDVGKGDQLDVKG